MREYVLFLLQQSYHKIKTGRFLYTSTIITHTSHIAELKMDNLFLPYDVLGMVMDYLTPRDLFNLVFLSPGLMNLVTTEMVVRSALFNGGRAKQSFKELYKLIKQRSIHPPSPLRLLRLACLKKCEVCLNSVLYDCNNAVQAVRKGWGTSCCWRCLTEKGVSKPFKKTSVEYHSCPRIYDAILDSDRVASKQYGFRDAVQGAWAWERKRARKMGLGIRFVNVINLEDGIGEFDSRVLQIQDRLNFMWTSPLIDRAGEKVGPIVTYEDIPNIVNQLKTDGFVGKRGTGLAVKTYLSNNMHAAPEDHVLYTSFIEAYEAAIGPAKLHLEYVMWKKKTITTDVKISKMHKCIELVHRLGKLIDDHRVRSVLVYDVNEWFVRGNAAYTKIPPILFKELWMRAIMFDCLVAPSKVTVGALKELSVSITEEYFKKDHSHLYSNYIEEDD